MASRERDGWQLALSLLCEDSLRNGVKERVLSTQAPRTGMGMNPSSTIGELCEPRPTAHLSEPVSLTGE